MHKKKLWWGKTGEYTPLKYLEGTGTGTYTSGQYIDTGIQYTENVGIEISFAFVDQEITAAKHLIGGQVIYEGSTLSRYNPLYCTVVGGVSKIRTLLNIAGTSSITRDFDTNIHVLQFNRYPNKKVVYDGVDEGTVESVGTGNNINLFRRNLEQGYGYCSGRIYACRIWDGTTLVRDFIPVLDKNGTPCMLDRVENKLYYNQGDGDFLYEEWDITPCDFVYADGNAYVNTQYYGDENTATEVYVKSEDLAYRIAIGSRQSAQTNNITTVVCDTVGGVVQDFGDYRITRQTTSAITSGNYVRCYNSKSERWMLEDGGTKVTTTTAFTGTLATTTPIYVGYRGAGSYPGTCSNFKGNYKLAKIYQNGCAVRDFVPAIDENNRAGFYDKCLNIMFYSVGTSEFAWGGTLKNKKMYNIAMSTGAVPGVGRSFTHTSVAASRLSWIPSAAGTVGVTPTGTTKDMFNNGGIVVKSGDQITITIESGWDTALVLWYSDTMVSNVPSFVTGSRTVTISSGYDRLGIVLRKSDNSNIDTSEASAMTVERTISTE